MRRVLLPLCPPRWVPFFVVPTTGSVVGTIFGFPVQGLKADTNGSFRARSTKIIFLVFNSIDTWRIQARTRLCRGSATQEQKAAASCLRTLAFKNDANKERIVECNALPLLVTMLHSDERELHYEAVGAIGNLVHSAPLIKKAVLEVRVADLPLRTPGPGHRPEVDHESTQLLCGWVLSGNRTFACRAIELNSLPIRHSQPYKDASPVNDDRVRQPSGCTAVSML
jgi:hypothetical protein